jgi:SAM-dependent methyltransferase
VPETQRERAQLFDREAERYDRTRPGYPLALIDAVVASSANALSVLDVGCGTGIASRLMAERGAQVLGVELNGRMAEIAQRHGIPVEVAPFETWDPAGRTFDRVISAQAWHWLDPAESAEKAASVLRPDGRLCVFWSAGHHPEDLAEALRAAYERVLPRELLALIIGYAANRSSDPTADFSVVTDRFGACERLAQPEMTAFPWVRTYTRDLWLDELLSHSDHISLDAPVREALFDEIGRTIDRFGVTFDMPYVTTLISARRR